MECIASIGPVYWHTTPETLEVSARERELPNIFGNNVPNTGNKSEKQRKKTEKKRQRKKRHRKKRESRAAKKQSFCTL